MAELTISADDIQGAIQDYVSSFEADTGREEIGTVIDAGDGIAHVFGEAFEEFADQAAAARGAQARPDAARRPPLRHRERPLRLRPGSARHRTRRARGSCPW